MKFAPVTDVKAKFSSYLKASEEEPVVITKNGRPMAVLLPLEDEEALERLLLEHSSKFQKILNLAKEQIRESGGIPHEHFWSDLESD